MMMMIIMMIIIMRMMMMIMMMLMKMIKNLIPVPGARMSWIRYSRATKTVRPPGFLIIVLFGIILGYTGLINCFVTIDELVHLFQILADFDFSGCYLCIINANTQYSNNTATICKHLKSLTKAVGTYEAEYFLPKSSFHCFQTARTWLR